MTRTLDPKKRKRIRETAISLFYRHGIENVSMAQIAREAGLAKGTGYLYFPSRKELLEDLFLYSRDRCMEACDRDLEEEPTACGKLKRRIRNMLVWHRDYPQEAWMQRAFNIPPSMKRDNYERMSPHYLAERQIIEAGVKAGEIKDLPIELSCEMLFSAVGGVIRYVNLCPGVLEDEAMLDIVLTVMLEGIAKVDK